ncbi:MAG: tetratricopeptide repeat protein [Pseudomonadota bacterium]|nr:tetratricopeptide repeat protein [Pseudomonadota bacterium]
MNKYAFTLAASPLAIGLALTGCATGTTAQRSSFATPSTAPRDIAASASYEAAQRQAQSGNLVDALRHAENAVAKSPRDAGYRMLLSDLYLKQGRFASAETAFGDVLTLDPGNSRAMLNLALAEIALGKNYAAVVRLDRLAQTEAPGDVGLAYALAGQPDRAVQMLETAARSEGADGRVRQNLALAYALTGDWQKARVTAAQDLSPADLPARMEQWATFAQPQTSFDQIARLLGVTPADDSGQPVRLALNPVIAEPVAVARVEEAVAPVAVAVAEVPAYQAPAKEIVETVDYAAAVETLVTQETVAVPVPVVRAIAPTFVAASVPFKAAPRTTGSSRYIVQLGAYASAANVDRAWTQAQKRYGFGDGHAPLRATVTLPGKGIVHRLSVAGYASRGEASQSCQSIKAKGGACFVRTVSGDAPIRIAAR